MPSTEKLLHFLSAACVSAAGVCVLGYGMSTHWAAALLDCGPATDDLLTGSSALTVGLFDGTETKIACPRIDKLDEPVEVFSRLVQMGGAPIILHALVLMLQAAALLCSAGSIFITLFNSFSNPYQTYLGAVGLFACSGLSASLGLLALLLFLLNIYALEMFQTLVLADEKNAKLKLVSAEPLLGFFLLIPYICCNLLAMLVVRLYVRATHTRRRAQEKPTEDTPKDIMMY